MFRRLAPLALILLAAPLPAAAQNLIRIPTCGTASAPPTGPGYMDATGNQCSSATLSGGTITANTTATAAASPPSYSPGDQKLSQNLSGGLRMQPSLGGTDMTLGQKTMSASLPVVIASDQSAITVSGTSTITGNVATQPVARTSVASSALAANLVVNAAASNLYSFTVSADSTLYASDYFIMAYDATSAPADGAVTPKLCYSVAAGTRSTTAAFPNPIAFTTGIVLGVSTTGCFTKTASTHATFIQGAY